jgi:uncharacterized protein (TIGR04255 family)
MTTSPTPSFKNPPVIETIAGIQFAPLQEWTVPHFGLYWSQVRRQFQRVEVHPPVAPEIDGSGTIRIALVEQPNVRCWYIGPRPTELVQVQQDRFLVNWRQLTDSDAYPHYIDRTRPLFVEQLSAFLAFLKQESISDPQIIRCELTYVNHIIKGNGWEVAADWDKVFTVCGDLRGEDFLPAPESRRFALNYPMPSGNGSIDVDAARAIRKRDAKDVIQFTIKAKGRPESSTADDIYKWMDNAHDWVVKSFAELTTKEMHDRWERIQ